jgi:hypothetical protein
MTWRRNKANDKVDFMAITSGEVDTVPRRSPRRRPGEAMREARQLARSHGPGPFAVAVSSPHTCQASRHQHKPRGSQGTSRNASTNAGTGARK